MWKYSYEKGAALYLVPTPIGNIEDITMRALNILKTVDVVYSEDTRVTRVLFNHFEIKTTLRKCHEHNEEEKKYEIENHLKEGKKVALVSDRGTPVVSDPGYQVVKYLVNKNYKVISLPGATALIPALTVSGLAPNPFLFYGFLNSKPSKRKEELRKLELNSTTMIFYESPHRLEETIKNMYEIFGNRKISISREITKKFEEIYHGDLKSLLSDLKNIKGEYVLVVEGKLENDYTNLTIVEHVNLYIKEGYSEMEAIKKVAKDRKIQKNIVYKEYHIK